MRTSFAFAAAMAALVFAAPVAAQAPKATDWASYNRDAGGTRFSPLKQVTPANVGRLQVAWTYHMKPAAAPRMLGSQATPLVINGVMYAATPYNQIVALDATTGQEKWKHTLPNNDSPAIRGMEYWAGDARHGGRLIFGTRTGKLMALNAADGTPVTSFGAGGMVDMKTPEIMQGLAEASFSLSSTPVIWGGLIITGSRVQERPVKGAAGDIRAWDLLTGKLVWTFHTVPRKGEFGYDTWAEGTTEQRSGVNVWSFMTVDPKTGVLYAPVAAPSYDRYGGDRIGANLFANSLVALDARTGKRLWHYQTVHHDLWDHDLPAQPVLFDVKRGASSIPSVGIINKSGLLFILDRRSGKPVYEVKETPVPQSTVPTEVSWPTQPIPVKPAPLARQSFDPAKDLVSLTPELRAFCEKRMADEKLVGSVQFEPLKFNQMMVRFPGSGGGANWGGAAFDPANGYYVINMTNVGSVENIVLRDGVYTSGAGANSWFSDNQKKLMCQEPPWGTLVAVDVNTGEIAWESRLGVTDSMPEGKRNTGRPNVGGVTTTAGGLVFVAATDDARLRAFDSKTGKELWATKLGAAAHNTPVTYQGADGRQYVSITSAGGSYLGSPATDDSIVAYALPK
jgi:quinoprotein glucose dehydrogenase